MLAAVAAAVFLEVVETTRVEPVGDFGLLNPSPANLPSP